MSSTLIFTDFLLSYLDSFCWICVISGSAFSMIYTHFYHQKQFLVLNNWVHYLHTKVCIYCLIVPLLPSCVCTLKTLLHLAHWCWQGCRVGLDCCGWCDRAFWACALSLITVLSDKDCRPAVQLVLSSRESLSCWVVCGTVETASEGLGLFALSVLFCFWFRDELLGQGSLRLLSLKMAGFCSWRFRGGLWLWCYMRVCVVCLWVCFCCCCGLFGVSFFDVRQAFVVGDLGWSLSVPLDSSIIGLCRLRSLDAVNVSC